MKFRRLGVLAAAIAAIAVTTQAPLALAAKLGPADHGAVASAGFHLPYTDPDQAGWLTLCGTNLLPVTQGSITTVPFAWRVVSSVPAPKGYFVKDAKATMFAYQPRPYTPAGAWSGTVMGAASYYSNQAHPMAQFTPIDSPLTQMTKAYPPIWDHLIELRLYLSAPNTPTLTTHYAAADIQVIGLTWRLVAGGNSSCTAGQAVSEEVVVGMPGARAKPKPAPGGPVGQRGTGSSHPLGASGGGSTAGAAIVGIVIAVLVAAAATFGGLWWRRQHRAAAS